jgi:hypothetical protein
MKIKKDKIKYNKEYYLKNKVKIAKRKQEKHKKYPWKRILQNIQKRCNNKNSENYKWYGGKGIKCKITEEELKFLWFRDKAYNMEKPSIDRKDSNKDYTLDNCRFIERIENTIRNRRKIVLQFDLKGNFIKEWISINEASRKLNIDGSSISKCCLNKRISAYGFKWKFKLKKKKE